MTVVFGPLLTVTGHDIHLTRGGVKILRGVDITLDKPEIVALAGANGSGKTSLVSVLAGLISPNQGRVDVHDAFGDTPKRSKIGLVMQKPVILRRSVLANMNYALAMIGTDYSSRSHLITKALDTTKLSHVLTRDALTLSVGEQQRLALARTIALDPDILLVDEATSNLDPASAKIIEVVALDMVKRGLPILWVTHNLAQIKRLATRVLFLDSGQIEANQTTHAFFANPASKAAAEFIADATI